MIMSSMRSFDRQKVIAAPDEAGIYVLIGTRGVANYIGESPTSIRGCLQEHLNTGNVPASSFRYEVISEQERRGQRKRALIAWHRPRYNTQWYPP